MICLIVDNSKSENYLHHVIVPLNKSPVQDKTCCHSEVCCGLTFPSRGENVMQCPTDWPTRWKLFWNCFYFNMHHDFLHDGAQKHAGAALFIFFIPVPQKAKVCHRLKVLRSIFGPTNMSAAEWVSEWVDLVWEATKFQDWSDSHDSVLSGWCPFKINLHKRSLCLQWVFHWVWLT